MNHNLSIHGHSQGGLVQTSHLGRISKTPDDFSPLSPEAFTLSPWLVKSSQRCRLPAHLGAKVVTFFATKLRKARMRSDRCWRFAQMAKRSLTIRVHLS